MPYISTERVKEIRTELKSQFPDFKFSVRTENYSTVAIAILEAPFNMLPEDEKKYTGVNHFYIAEHYKDEPEIKEVLLKIKDIANKGNGTLVEDGDYGTVPNFYIDIKIGNYDNPFKVVEHSEIVEDGLATATAAATTGIEIRHNQQQNGIEIKFPGKPDNATLQTIKDSHLFRWSKFNKVWYSKINNAAIAFAKQFGELPPTLTA